MASDYQHVEVNCQRAIGGGQFAAGLQDFVFSIGRPSVFIPSKSYFRVQMSVTAPAGAPLAIRDQVALAENCVANMYNNAYFLAGGQSVSQVTNYLPQAAALEYRTSTSNAWLKSVGTSAFAYNPNLSSRISALSAGQAVAGFSQDEGKDLTYRPTTAGAFRAATLAIADIATGVVTQAAGAAITEADDGATLVIKGHRYGISVTAGPIVKIDANLVTGGTIAATPDWYLIRRASKATDPSLEGKNSLYVLWKPTVMGIFNHPGVLGSGDYRIQLNPDPNFRTSAIETLNPDYTVVADSYELTITNVVFYAAVAKMELPDVVEQLKLTEFSVLTKNASTPTGNYQFTVPSSTSKLYVAIQAGDSSMNPAHPPSRFIVGGSQELNLKGIQVTYANTTKPMTRWQSSFESGGNLMTQAYYSTAVEGGRAAMSGGIESEADWLSRGPFMCFRYDRDFSDRSTEVQIQIDYGAAGWNATAKILLIAEYTNRVDITTQGGLVTSVDKVASA